MKNFWDTKWYQLATVAIGLGTTVAVVDQVFGRHTFETIYLYLIIAIFCFSLIPVVFGKMEVGLAFLLVKHSIYNDQSHSDINSALFLIRHFPMRVMGGRLFEEVRSCIEAKLLCNEVATEPIIINNIGQIYERKKEIMSYFEAVSKYKPSRIPQDDIKNKRFLSQITVKTGFLAPHYLVAGLLPEFNDEWEPAIDDYGRSMSEPKPRLAVKKGGSGQIDLRELQAFQFICWLSWGPSIPICSCSQWTGSVGIQFGYGDEDNSIPVIMPRSGTGSNAVEIFKNLAKQDLGNCKVGKQIPALAFQASITAELWWDAKGDMLTRAQRYHTAPEGAHGRLLFKCPEDPRTPQLSDFVEARRYFSAYVWVLFVICDADGNAIWKPDVHQHGDYVEFLPTAQVWRGLLPFFEHANIANGANYLLLKKQVARKALAVLDAVCQEQTWSNLTFRYVCALDDTGCLRGNTAFSTPGADTVREVMTGMVKDFHNLSTRVILDPNEQEELEFLSACHFSAMVRSYYETIHNHGESI